MKETQSAQQIAEPQEQVAQAQQKTGKHFKGRYTLKDGHKVFELNLLTGAVEEAKYETTANVEFGKGKAIKMLVEQKDCIYLPALNKKNARKKFLQIIDRAR